MLSRAYYHCASCGTSLFPRDAQLGCAKAGISPAVENMVARTAATVSFEESAELLRELAGITVTAKMIERSAENTGADISRDEKEIVHYQIPAAATMYVGMDGTGTPMRTAEIAGRLGKQPDGTAKTREAKIVTVWTAEARAKDGTPERDPGSVSYSAAIESAAMLDTDEQSSDFAERVRREARRRGVYDAKRIVVLGDGAPWIWKVTDEVLPNAIQIVDRFHVKEHLAVVATAIFGAESADGNAWREARYLELDDGDIAALMVAVRQQAGSNDEARKCVGYLETNAARMRYRAFRAMGLCTSSGVVEAGCKVVVGKRLKQAGMRWTLRGANAVMALRCCKLSGRLPGYQERLRQNRAA